MPEKRNISLSPRDGTRFLVFAQSPSLPSFKNPVRIRISLPPDRVQPGPADDQIYVLDVPNKLPYRSRSPQVYTPFDGREWSGFRAPPPPPGPNGHYDHLEPGTPGFAAAASYASVRRVLDIWQRYFRKAIKWHFKPKFARLEIVPQINDANAHAGFGFVEFGYGMPGGRFTYVSPFWRNFDVVAHETGHMLLYAKMRFPRGTKRRDEWLKIGTPEFRAFHESSADLVAIVSSLHFRSVTNHLLEETRGNLFTNNELSRVGELSESYQIRNAFNDKKMSSVHRHRHIPHELSLPLTGAVFDILVEVFQKNLLEASLISQNLANQANRRFSKDGAPPEVQRAFNRAFKGRKRPFARELGRARDYLGKLLARTWSTLPPDKLTFVKVGRSLLHADRAIGDGDGAHQDTIRRCFKWRGLKL